MAGGSGMKKKLLIMLTRLRYTGAKLIGFLTQSLYTHASIALEDEPDTFYSFNLRGFNIEHPKGLLKKRREPFLCRIYSIEVSERIYQAAKHLIEEFVKDREQYHYSIPGIILALFHIPFTLRRRFFCSHFVAEVLEKSGALHLKKRSCLYMPGDLEHLNGISLSFTGTVQDYACSLA